MILLVLEVAVVDCARGEEDPALSMKNVVLEVAFKVRTISSDEMTSSIFLTLIVPFTLVLDWVPCDRITQGLRWVILEGIRGSQVIKLEGFQLLMLLLYGLTSLCYQLLGERKRPFRHRLRLMSSSLISFGFGIGLFLGLSFSLCDSTSNSHCHILLRLNSLVIITILTSFLGFLNFGQLFVILLTMISSDILYC